MDRTANGGVPSDQPHREALGARVNQSQAAQPLDHTVYRQVERHAELIRSAVTGEPIGGAR